MSIVNSGCALALAALAPSFVLAQGPPDSTRTPPDSGVQIVAPVVVTGTVLAPAVVGGASAVVLRPDSVTTVAAPSLEQVLREMPFVLVRQNSRGETELSVRGSDSRQAAVLVDGVPLTLGWDHRTDPSLVPLTGARQLTLVRGLSSLLAGPNVLGGAVQVDVAGGAGAAGPSGLLAPELSLSTGLDHEGARVLGGAGALPIEVGQGLLTLRGGGAYHEREGVALGRDARTGGDGANEPAEGTDAGQLDDPGLRTNSDLRQADGIASLRYESVRGAYVGLTGTVYQATRGVPPELHVAEPRLWRYPDITRAFGVLTVGTGRRETPWGRGGVDISAGINDGHVEIESFADATYRTRTGRETGDEQTITARVHATHSLPGAGEIRAAVTQADVRYDERIDDDPANRYRQRLSSAGVEAQWMLFSRALVSGGIVHDAASTPETGGKASLGDLSRLGWRVGATTFALGSTLRLHAAVSDRARFPALRELYSGSLDRFEANPALQPERLLGAEMGVTVIGGAAMRAGLSLQAVAFHHRLRDAVVRISTTEGRFRRINRDEIRSTGLELLGSWSPGLAGSRGRPSWSDGVSLSSNLLVQRVRIIDPSLPVGVPSERHAEHQPEVRSSISVGIPLALAVHALASAHYTGRQFCVHPDLGRQVALGPQTGGDLALTREWSLEQSGLLRTLRAVLALDNVTDATIFDQCGLPRPGRTLRVTLQLR